ncbi:MAG TPA: hypothetical protein VGR90_02350, partial [Acidimicrobiales bacterium]|nr:hypothetical protein [Acidimicrobiales bacterium]
GGMASLWGPLLGSLFVIGLPSLLQRVSSSLSFLSNGNNNGVISPTDAADITFGVLLIIFLVVEPRGLMGLVHRIAAAVKTRQTRPPAAVGPMAVQSSAATNTAQ